MTKKSVLRLWLLVFVSFFAFFIVLQVPARWLLGKFSPNLRYIHNVNGNIWQGEADWSYQQLQGTVSWTTRPWELLRLRAASNIHIHTGQTELKGIVSYGLGKNIYLQNVSGQVSPETLTTLSAWQLPSTSIHVQDLSLQYKQQQGFKAVQGQLTWAGGMLHYPMGQRVERIDIPPLVAEFNTDKDNLKMQVRDSQKQRMADLTLGTDGMLDVQLTQRFLLNAPSYQGKAGLDTAVISTRQPLNSLRGR